MRKLVILVLTLALCCPAYAARDSYSSRDSYGDSYSQSWNDYKWKSNYQDYSRNYKQQGWWQNTVNWVSSLVYKPPAAPVKDQRLETRDQRPLAVEHGLQTIEQSTQTIDQKPRTKDQPAEKFTLPEKLSDCPDQISRKIFLEISPEHNLISQHTQTDNGQSTEVYQYQSVSTSKTETVYIRPQDEDKLSQAKQQFFSMGQPREPAQTQPFDFAQGEPVKTPDQLPANNIQFAQNQPLTLPDVTPGAAVQSAHHDPIRQEPAQKWEAAKMMTDEQFLQQACLPARQAQPTVPKTMPSRDAPIQRKVYLDNSPDYKFTGQTHTPIAPGAGVIYQIFQYTNKQTGETESVSIHPADMPKLQQIQEKIAPTDRSQSSTVIAGEPAGKWSKARAQSVFNELVKNDPYIRLEGKTVRVNQQTIAWETGKGAIIGAAQGAGNAVKGAWGGVKETGFVMADAGRLIVANALGKDLPQLYSSTANALANGSISEGEYYWKLGSNTATFGMAGQVEAGFDLYAGKISVDEFSQRVGGTAIMQFGGAAFAKYAVGKTPTFDAAAAKVAGILSKDDNFVIKSYLDKNVVNAIIKEDPSLKPFLKEAQQIAKTNPEMKPMIEETISLMRNNPEVTRFVKETVLHSQEMAVIAKESGFKLSQPYHDMVGEFSKMNSQIATWLSKPKTGNPGFDGYVKKWALLHNENSPHHSFAQNPQEYAADMVNAWRMERAYKPTFKWNKIEKIINAVSDPMEKLVLQKAMYKQYQLERAGKITNWGE
jgi:hypothetical protein